MKIIVSDLECWIAVLALVFVLPFSMVAFVACFVIIGDQVTAGLTHSAVTIDANDVFIKMLPMFFLLSLIGLCLVAFAPIGGSLREE